MRWAWIVLTAIVVMHSGCGKKAASEPKNISECKARAQAARDQAKAFRESRKPKEAAESSAHALHCSQLAKQMLKASQSPSEADRAACAETAEAARQAKLLAELADEDGKLDKITSSWRAKAYKPARALAFKAAFVSLSAAARQAKSADPDKLPQGVRDLGKAAEDVGSILNDRPRLPDGKPDWDNIAKDMDAYAANSPPMMSAVMVVALLMGGQLELALVEAQAMDHTAMEKTPDAHLAYHFLRAAALSFNGLPQLSIEQADEVAKVTPSKNIKGPELVGSVNLFIAFNHLEQKNYTEADKSVVRAMQAWPDNPLSVFLTGDKLAANGQYEEAADSLEKECKDTKNEWLAKKLAARAREVRDKKGRVQPLFTDKVFLAEVLLTCLGKSAGEEASAWTGKLASSAQRLGQTLLDKLPDR